MLVKTDSPWPRACRRGAVLGLVLASHAALFVLIVLPPRQRLVLIRSAPRERNVLRIELLPQASVVAPTVLSRRKALAAPSASRVTRPQRPRQRRTAVATLVSAPVASQNPSAPAFIAGGDLIARLHATQAAPALPKLPGGHHFLASDLQFVPVEQQSIKGKLQKVAGLLFGGFDPVCENTQYELAKPRAQQIADGFTEDELRQRLREHHCS